MQGGMANDNVQAEVLAFLGDPATHGGPVERIDTHGACVFLTAERAYKIKRAVRYSYLDFSTLEKRREMCLRECHLNRRTAPDIYLAVLPVVRGAEGALTIGDACAAPESVVEWMVVMRRFEPDTLFQTMVREGRLEAIHIRQLADAIATFHATKATKIEDDGVERVLRVIEGNRESMAATDANILPPQECEDLLRKSKEELKSRASTLRRRAASGYVRHCHGDLHLGNICLWNGVPTPFDCLEFNDEFAISDILYDLAFAVMDLWHRDQRRLASLLFNRYCDMADVDGEGLAVMPLFLSMRAAVRAHVSATQAHYAGKGPRWDSLRIEGRSYIHHAMAFLEQSAPRLIAVGGLSGTGKSTLAAALAPDLGRAPGARWLRTDVLRKRMAGVVPETRLPAEAYSPGHSRDVYAKLLEKAADTLKKGTSVIIDGVFARADERFALEAIARELAVPFHGLWLTAPVSVLRDRVFKRTGDASDADVTVLEQQLQHNPIIDVDWLQIEASGTPDDVLREAWTVLS